MHNWTNAPENWVETLRCRQLMAPTNQSHTWRILNQMSGRGSSSSPIQNKLLSACGIGARTPEKSNQCAGSTLSSKYFRHAVSSIIMGDMNCHNPEWLHFSKKITPKGNELEAVCCACSIQQVVNKQTRGPYLPDRVLSDLASAIRCCRAW